jgi:hypothetical protein
MHGAINSMVQRVAAESVWCFTCQSPCGICNSHGAIWKSQGSNYSHTLASHSSPTVAKDIRHTRATLLNSGRQSGRRGRQCKAPTRACLWSGMESTAVNMARRRGFPPKIGMMTRMAHTAQSPYEARQMWHLHICMGTAPGWFGGLEGNGKSEKKGDDDDDCFETSVVLGKRRCSSGQIIHQQNGRPEFVVCCRRHFAC